MACVFLEQNKYHQALEPLERASELATDDSVPQIQMGRIHFKLKNPALAEKYFKEAKQLDSKNADIPNLLGDVYYDQKRFFQAEAEYRQAVGLNPKHAAAHKNLGHVCLEQKKHKDAERHFQESIRLDPASAAALVKIRIRPQSEIKPPLGSEATG